MIQARQASLLYQDHGRTIHACQEVDLEVKPGQFLGILGPSGSGKSSLLYLLSGLKQPTSGEVVYGDRTLNSLNDEERSRLRLHDFGFVFQYPYLIGYLTSLENVVSGAPEQGMEREAKQLLQDLGLADLTHRYPHELSGGQKQRVCVARALIGNRRVVFADEPTAALDQKAGREVVNLLNDRRGDGALVMVTHDPDMLERADRIIEIHDGRISLAGSSEPAKLT